MARMSLAELKAQFQKKNDNEGSGSSSWEHFYPFWKIEFDEMAVIRFLPDADQDNPFGFYIEDLTHTLIINGKKKVVPCLQMYGQSCPCCEKSKKFYDLNKSTGEEQYKALGKKYYRKKEILASILIQNSPFEFTGGGDNPAKMIKIGTKLFDKVKAGITSGDVENDPDSLTDGYDFRIRKTKQGDYADYSTSGFAPRSSAVDPSVIESLELYNLAAQRTKAITREQMEALLLAEETGSDVADDAAGAEAAPAAESTQKSAAAADLLASVRNRTAAAAESAAPAAEASSGQASPSDKANDLLESIRKRAAAAAANKAAS